jgi:hypothetical protein
MFAYHDEFVLDCHLKRAIGIASKASECLASLADPVYGLTDHIRDLAADQDPTAFGACHMRDRIRFRLLRAQDRITDSPSATDAKRY